MGAMMARISCPHLAGLAGVNEARVKIYSWIASESSFPLSRFQSPHPAYEQSSTAVSLRLAMAAITRFLGTSSALRRLSLVSPALLSFRRGIAYKLFVGGLLFLSSLYLASSILFGLSFLTTEKGLSEAFSDFGQVVEAKIVMDRVSDRSKGFGFVTFASEDEAENAITGMNGKALNGRVIFVDYAKPKRNIGDGMPIARGPPEPTAHS
ncbi:small RNA-binding protein 11, chloroplastic-like isoform X2 [Prosopis cineraria]|uniref:small RNA-binding protein 11, chloroplastic-like isoform X2 n=1 Tax=Prosopis cineraria TaxID=364024 RepID=UPI00240F0B8B|nr:small RNA-binding protein 11, chloroplastic-like isoform X2 [Prosopis cineraria]